MILIPKGFYEYAAQSRSRLGYGAVSMSPVNLDFLTYRLCAESSALKGPPRVFGISTRSYNDQKQGRRVHSSRTRYGEAYGPKLSLEGV